MGEINTGATGASSITRELVDQVYDEVRTDFLVLQRDEMGFAREHDLASLILYGKLVGKTRSELDKELDPETTAPPVMAAERAGRAVGYLAAHRLLRTAVGGPFGEQQSSDALIAYYEDVLVKHPGRLEGDFRRSWGPQEAVSYLVDEKLTKTDSRFGAKLLLVIHGRLVNPNQPKFREPSRERADRSPVNMGISLPHQGSRNNHEAQAQLLRNRRIAAYTGGGRRFN